MFMAIYGVCLWQFMEYVYGNLWSIFMANLLRNDYVYGNLWSMFKLFMAIYEGRSMFIAVYGHSHNQSPVC